MISSGNQNQFPSSFAPLRYLLKALMFLSNLNGFNSSPSPPDHRFAQRKGSSKVWKEKGSKWFNHFFSLPLFLLCITCVFCFLVLSQSSFMLCFVFNMFMFVCCFHFCFSFFFINFFFLKNQENTKIVCVMCTLVLVYLEWSLKQSFLNFVSFVA